MWISATEPQPIDAGVFTSVFGAGNLGPVPSLAIWTAAFALLGWLILNRTPFGRRVLATGGNEVAARYSGVRTRRVTFAVLVISGAVAAVAGMLYAGRLSSGRYQWGQGDELSVIAASILGGTSLFGGKGAVVGSVAGSLLIGMVDNGLILMGLDLSQQEIVRGAIIILAVALGRR